MTELPTWRQLAEFEVPTAELLKVKFLRKLSGKSFPTLRKMALPSSFTSNGLRCEADHEDRRTRIVTSVVKCTPNGTASHPKTLGT
jgi:hypothetical protein